MSKIPNLLTVIFLALAYVFVGLPFQVIGMVPNPLPVLLTVFVWMLIPWGIAYVIKNHSSKPHAFHWALVIFTWLFAIAYYPVTLLVDSIFGFDWL